MFDTIQFRPIGIIHSPYTSIEGMPIQSKGATGVKGTVEVKKELSEGLVDLESFSHIYLIYHFHKSVGYDLQVIPFLDHKFHGVFSTRAPRRPNSIGISVVKLLGRKENLLQVENIDILDGTPLLDIKPYISAFDRHTTEKKGWLKNPGNLNDIRSDERFK